ncbi:AAA+ ATPase [Trema orientale]|uniref:AAA+ ATPase n=1 Tax=Trema orientale TaxID=63057 RepID=A0A2P5CEW9_TREOI|nr:AAA+ ATPase [Trema orientale]
MEVVIAVGTAIVGKLAEYTVDSVRQLFHCTSNNVNNLRARIEELKEKKDELQGQVNEAISVGDAIVDDVRMWLSRADAMSQEAEAFLDVECRASDKCFGGYVPDLVSQRRLSKRAKKIAEDLVSQTEAAGRIDRVSIRPALQTPLEIEGDYKPFESRKKAFEEIMEALRDPEVSKIGVYGMGGIGKTMLAKEVARQATKEKLFGVVAITTVSQTPNLQKIQRDIAEGLNLRFGEVESTRERAHRLQTKLKEEKKDILIILDDIWKRLDLVEVGIHFGDGQKGCKILLTSRYLNCVRSAMGAEKNFPVEVLSSDEATNLFKKIVGDNTLADQPLAIDIVGECGKLPLAITTVAYALKDEGLPTWNDALQQLRNSTLKNIEGMSEDVYKSIRLSYDFLKSEEEKSFLLLCSLYEEDADIDVEELTRYCVGWDMFPNIQTLRGARTRIDSLVGKLKAHCLLLDGEYYGTVKMHDIIRDVAKSIASEDRGMDSIIFGELEDRMRSLTNLKAVSLLRCDNPAQIPESLECPQLELLLFIKSSYFAKTSANIPDSFFAQSKLLKIFSWKFARIVSLPSSFHLLQNLQTLCVRVSTLEDIATIGDLKNLKVLDLSKSTIECLPQKIGELPRLRLLDLRGCAKLKVIEPNVISNLTQLEELYMPEEFQGWEVEDDGIDVRRNTSLTELRKLQKCLTVLYLCVLDAKVMPKDLFSEKLERYRISIGSQHDFYPQDGISRSLHLHLNQRSQLNALGLKLLMKKSEYLSLDGIEGVNNMVYDLDMESFPQLKHLRFCNNDGVQYITNSVNQSYSCPVFPSLESLSLDNLTKLERICHGELPPNSFNKLREVEVSNCGELKNQIFPLSIVKRLHNVSDEAALKVTSLSIISSCKSIKYLFSFAMAERLVNLEELNVSSCEAMEYILLTEKLGEDGIPSEKILFRKLKYLKLSALPALKNFCSGDSCIEEVSVNDKDANLVATQPLFSEEVSFPNLENLYVEEMNVEKLWPKELLVNSYIQNLTTLKVKRCNGLKYLFRFVMAESLVNLKRLKVVECKAVEDILLPKREEGIRLEKTIVFPKLEDLKLKELQALKRFCAADSCLEFPSLSELHMVECPQLKTFVMPVQVSVDNEKVNQLPLIHEKVILPNLKYLTCTDRWSEGINEIFDMSQSSIIPAFRNVKHLIVECKSHDKPIAISNFKFLERYQNIKTLLLSGFFVDGILWQHHQQQQQQHGGVAQENDGAYKLMSARLKELYLYDVHMLRHLFGDPSNTIAFPTLQALFVERCSRLQSQSIAPSFMSFHNLETLEVSGCHGLTYLLASSTAASLVHLKEMRIGDCKRMTEIINKKGDEITESGEEDELVFRSLEVLVLYDLPNLKSFYSGNNALSFPSLEKLFVNRCPEMRTFSRGIISTSSLLNTIVAEIKDESQWQYSSGYLTLFAEAVRELWDTNVNTTIRKLWEKDDSNSGLEQLFAHETIDSPVILVDRCHNSDSWKDLTKLDKTKLTN